MPVSAIAGITDAALIHRPKAPLSAEKIAAARAPASESGNRDPPSSANGLAASERLVAPKLGEGGHQPPPMNIAPSTTPNTAVVSSPW